MVLPITQTPVYNNPYSPGNPPVAMSRTGMPYPQPGPPESKGGFLQNLLSGVLPGTSGGLGMNADSIIEKLDQVQRVLGVVQKTAPIVQQYGPMVKQLPAMLQMIKALNDADTEDGEETFVNEDANQTKPDNYSLNEDTLGNIEDTPATDSEESKQSTEEPEESSSLKQPPNGQSIPKLFI